MKLTRTISPVLENELKEIAGMNDEEAADGRTYWTDSIKSVLTGINLNKQQPAVFNLQQNYPNPFNPDTKIKYSISHIGFVTFRIYDILGREIETLVHEEKPAGTYEVEFNGGELPSGVYFYRLASGSFVQTKKAVLLM